MLVFTRKIGQSIIIGDKGEIRVTLLGFWNNQCKLGIDAPKIIPVHREEIFMKILEEQKGVVKYRSELNYSLYEEEENYEK